MKNVPKILRLPFNSGPKAIGPYSPAVLHNNTLYISGQLGLDREGTLAPCIESQTTQMMANLQSLLQQHSLSMSHIVKTTLYLQNMTNFITVNKIYQKYFQNGQYPARVAIAVKTLPKNALVEIQAICAVTDAEVDSLANKLTKQK